MKTNIFLGSLFTLALFWSDKCVLSDQTVSVSELQNEIVQLKAQLQELNSKLEFILKTCVRNEDIKEHVDDIPDPVEERKEQETSVLIIERLEQVERILTEAPEGMDFAVLIYNSGVATISPSGRLLSFRNWPSNLLWH